MEDAFRKGVTEKDDIVIDRAFSKLTDDSWDRKFQEKGYTFFNFQRHILHPRVVPFYSYPRWINVEGKVRSEPFAQVQLAIPSGLELRYQGRHWSQEERVQLRLSYKQMRQLITDFTAILKRYDR